MGLAGSPLSAVRLAKYAGHTDRYSFFEECHFLVDAVLTPLGHPYE